MIPSLSRQPLPVVQGRDLKCLYKSRNGVNPMSQLTLIDAEILRCEGALVSGELLMRAKPPVPAWNKRLKEVWRLIQKMNRSGVAERLFSSVMACMENAILGLMNLKVQTGWEGMILFFVELRDSFKAVADHISFYDGKYSPFHAFDTIAEGMKFDESRAMQVERAKRDKWIDHYLSNIGDHILLLNNMYYDKAFSSGSGRLMKRIADVLKGVDEMTSNAKHDWRTALGLVIVKIKKIRPPEDRMAASLFKSVLLNLSNTVERLERLGDLNNDVKWINLYLRVYGKREVFSMLSNFPLIGQLATALHEGMDDIDTLESWGRLKSDQRDRKIEAILKGIGANLMRLESNYYDTFLPKGGGVIMREIATIFSEVAAM